MLIVGSSIVRDLEHYERFTGHRINTWRRTFIAGQSGLRLSGLENLVTMLMATHKPGFVIIHAGANDIGSLTSKEWADTLDSIIKNLSTDYPRVQFIWSDMLPRLKWRGHNTREAEKKRRRYQKEARAIFRKYGGSWITQPLLQVDKSLLKPDGVHPGNDGLRQLLRDFQQFIDLL